MMWVCGTRKIETYTMCAAWKSGMYVSLHVNQVHTKRIMGVGGISV